MSARILPLTVRGAVDCSQCAHDNTGKNHRVRLGGTCLCPSLDVQRFERVDECAGFTPRGNGGGK